MKKMKKTVKSIISEYTCNNDNYLSQIKPKFKFPIFFSFQNKTLQ